MLALALGTMAIYFCIGPTAMRKGIDVLAGPFLALRQDTVFLNVVVLHVRNASDSQGFTSTILQRAKKKWTPVWNRQPLGDVPCRAMGALGGSLSTETGNSLYPPQIC